MSDEPRAPTVIVFLTSIRHPQNANDYARVEALFEMSVQSVCAQSSADFRVVVVCNAVPNIGFKDPRIHYHVVDFPPPSQEAKAATGMAAVLKDKGTKLLSGCLYAQRFDPSYIMIFDADDLVSRDLAVFLERNPGAPGWYVDKGYCLALSSMRIQRKGGLVRYCGTSVAFNPAVLFELTRANEALSEGSSQDDIYRNVRRSVVDWLFGDHHYVRRFFVDHGKPLRPLPFHASVWVLETGENHGDAGDGRRRAVFGVPMNREFRRQFGLDDRYASSESPGSARELAREVGEYWLSRAGFLLERMRGLEAFPA